VLARESRSESVAPLSVDRVHGSNFTFAAAPAAAGVFAANSQDAGSDQADAATASSPGLKITDGCEMSTRPALGEICNSAISSAAPAVLCGPEDDPSQLKRKNPHRKWKGCATFEDPCW